jgi:hypothetical protein
LLSSLRSAFAICSIAAFCPSSLTPWLLSAPDVDVLELLFDGGIIDPSWLVPTKVQPTKSLHPNLAALNDEFYYTLVKRAAAEVLLMRAANRTQIDDKVRIHSVESMKQFLTMLIIYHNNPFIVRSKIYKKPKATVASSIIEAEATGSSKASIPATKTTASCLSTNKCS